jgi:hypothetical protein
MTKECFLPDCKRLAEIVRALRIGKVEVPEAGFRKIASAGLLGGDETAPTVGQHNEPE